MKKLVFISATVVLLAAGCAKSQSVSPSVNQQTQSQAANKITTQPAVEPAVQPKSQAVSQPSVEKTQQSASVPGGLQVQGGPTGGMVVYETVDGSKFNLSAYQSTATETAYDLLSATHKVEAQSYSGIGEFVSSIDGITPDSKHFWELFVNGKSSNIGASSYVLKAGDKIEWKLSTIGSSSD